MSEIISNSLQILNVSDGTFDIEWQGELAAPPANPEKGWTYYDTTQGGTFLYDGENWHPISFDAKEGIVDQRFSNSLKFKLFTVDENGQAWGTTPGDYVGFRLVEKPPETLEELAASFDEYTWSVYTVNVAFNTSYDLVLNKDILYKFVQEDDSGTIYYTYQPSSLSLRLTATQNEITTALTDLSDITYNLNFIFNGQDSLNYPREGQETFIETLNIESILTELGASSYNLEQVNINIFRSNSLLISKTLACVYGVSTQLARLSINANNINAFVEDATLTFNGSGLTLKNGAFTIQDNNGNKLIYSEGDNLILRGTIQASSGNIGGWLIGTDQLYATTNSVGMYSGSEIQLNSAPVRFYAGTKGTPLASANPSTISFVVNDNGYVQAANANITGTIYAAAGAITDTFYVGNSENGIILSYDEGTKRSYIGSQTYTSGESGYGWRIENNGQAEFTNISARGKIASSVFEYQKTSSIGGSLYITPTIYLNLQSNVLTYQEDTYYSTWEASADSPIGVGGRAWSVGDEVRLEGIVAVLENGEVSEKITLNNIAGEVTEAVVDSTRANLLKITVSFKTSSLNSGKENRFIEGALLMFYGAYNNENKLLQKSGIYITAMDEHAPYIDIYDIDSMATYMPTVRLGKLTGITNTLFSDTALTGYGLYSDRAYLTGQLVLPGAGVTNESLEYIRDNESYGDIRFWAGETHTNARNAPFIVTSDGSIFASKGIFSGRVEATDGYFSGLIKAAGLLVDRLKSGEIVPSTAAKNHFFVAYSTTADEVVNTVDSIQSYDDYIVDISANGISIWEGAFQAYSDSAGKSKNGIYTHPVYGYDKDSHQEPLPYFYLVDAATNVNSSSMTLNSRIVAYKEHIFQANIQEDNYVWNGMLLDNGIWFGSGTIQVSDVNGKSQAESRAFSTYKDHGIWRNNLGIMEFISNSGYSFKNGNVNIINDLYMVEGTKKASIDIGGMSVEQAFTGNNIVGINFV